MKIQYRETEKNFTESHLIAYIGNKRRLLSLIQKAFQSCTIDQTKVNTFFDPFAGTGVVSRLAKTQGLKVICNDWEDYSFVINKLYIECSSDDLQNWFSSEGGVEKALDYYNSLPPLPYESSYIAYHYCPQNTNHPDPEKERMFYTRETGQKIDSIREAIDQKYGAANGNPLQQKEKNMLLALLTYEAATRANTSGVFKGFHYGFGGSGKDALTRIFKPLQLTKPVLYPNFHKHDVYKEDANQLVKRLCATQEMDITYLDPPYNQHQYGSNYHLLNTIIRNDKPAIHRHIQNNGVPMNKSAIRPDWIQTKSNYCYKQTAVQDFKLLIQDLKSHYILVSYSIDGIIPFDTMLEILSEKGKLDVVTSEYTKYRGGKQALTTQVINVEFVLIVDTHQKSSSKDILRVKDKLLGQTMQLYLKKPIHFNMALDLGFTIHGGTFSSLLLQKVYYDCQVQLKITDHLFIDGKSKENGYWKEQAFFSDFSTLSYATKKLLEKELESITNVTKEDELKYLLQTIQNLVLQDESKERVLSYWGKIPVLLKKFNNKKAYLSSLYAIREIEQIRIFLEEQMPALKKEIRYQNCLSKLNKIVQDKLAYSRHPKTDEIMEMKSLLSEELQVAAA